MYQYTVLSSTDKRFREVDSLGKALGSVLTALALQGWRLVSSVQAERETLFILEKPKENK